MALLQHCLHSSQHGHPNLNSHFSTCQNMSPALFSIFQASNQECPNCVGGKVEKENKGEVLAAFIAHKLNLKCFPCLSLNYIWLAQTSVGIHKYCSSQVEVQVTDFSCLEKSQTSLTQAMHWSLVAVEPIIWPGYVFTIFSCIRDLNLSSELSNNDWTKLWPFTTFVFSPTF